MWRGQEQDKASCPLSRRPPAVGRTSAHTAEWGQVGPTFVSPQISPHGRLTPPLSLSLWAWAACGLWPRGLVLACTRAQGRAPSQGGDPGAAGLHGGSDYPPSAPAPAHATPPSPICLLIGHMEEAPPMSTPLGTWSLPGARCWVSDARQLPRGLLGLCHLTQPHCQGCRSPLPPCAPWGIRNWGSPHSTCPQLLLPQAWLSSLPQPRCSSTCWFSTVAPPQVSASHHAAWQNPTFKPPS